MFAIGNDVLAPQFKSLNCALWYNTHAHSATRRVRLLVPALSKPCAIVVFGIQWFDKMSSRVDWNRGMKYLTEYYFLHVHVFYHVLLGCFFVVCLDPSLANDSC